MKRVIHCGALKSKTVCFGFFYLIQFYVPWLLLQSSTGKHIFPQSDALKSLNKNKQDESNGDECLQLPNGKQGMFYYVGKSIY